MTSCHVSIRRALLALIRPVSLTALAIAALGSCDAPAGSQASVQTGTQLSARPGPDQAAQTSRTPGTPGPRQSDRDPRSGLRWISRGELPREGQAMLGLIARGGPFRYGKDGAAFGNREGLLPAAARAYYREYTVQTPGEPDRGARRLVCGGQAETSISECYYTADHYASFRRVRP